MIELGRVEIVSEKRRCVNPLHVVEQRNKNRLILDCSILNNYIEHSGFEPSIGGEKCSSKMKPRANIYQVSRFYFAIEPKKRKGKFREIT